MLMLYSTGFALLKESPCSILDPVRSLSSLYSSAREADSLSIYRQTISSSEHISFLATEQREADSLFCSLANPSASRPSKEHHYQHRL